MAFPVTTASIPSLLRPGLKAVFTDTNIWGEQWSEIFTHHMSDKQVEYETEVKLLPIAQVKPEGQAIASGGLNQLYVTAYRNITIGMSFIITREAIMDDLYKAEFPMGSKALKDSLAQYKNVAGANVINNGFSNTALIADGQPLFSTSHPIENGVVANTFSLPAALNETSLENAIIGINQFRNGAGIQIYTRTQKLLLPSNLEFTGTRLTKSKFRTGTANNDISAIYSESSVPHGCVVNRFLTSPVNWTLLTDEPNGFKYYERESVVTDVQTDFSTNNLLCKAFERYSFGVSNFRAGFGVQGI